MKSRAILVVGMHRSGTSAVARGLHALSVYLGNDFLDAQPENPTGYWEDRGIVGLNEQILKTFGLTWEDSAPIAPGRFRGFRVSRLRAAAARHLKRIFRREVLWGFKDPRTIRLMPFWRRVLLDYGAEDAYVVTIRNPLSVAASLFRRQQMDLLKAQRLWLIYMVPHFCGLRERPMVVVDYDRMMDEPCSELQRIALRLRIPGTDATRSCEIDRFATEFLDARLRHSAFTADDFDAATVEARLTSDAFALLSELAAGAPATDAFWNDWQRIERHVCQLSQGW